MNKRWSRLFRKANFWDYCAFLLFIAFFTAGSLVSVNRYRQFDSFYFDFGIIDSAIWQVSHFKAPIIDHFVVGGKWIFADHLNPSIFLLSPIYWFFENSEVMFIVQSLAVAASGLVIYLVGIKLTKNKFLAFSVLFCYFLFVGLQNAIIFDIHEVTIATLFIALTFWAYFEKKFWLYFIFFLITLGFKESLFALGIALAITIALIERKVSKLALATFLISIVWGFLSIKIIKLFSEGSYQYAQVIDPNPIKIITSFFDEHQKRETLFYSFASFGFLPAFSIPMLPLIFQDILIRFYPDWSTRWTLWFHYSSILSVILAVSSIYFYKLFLTFKKIAKYTILVAVVSMLISLYLFYFKLNGPLKLVYNRAFYKHSTDFNFLNIPVRMVPKTASIMTQNNIASHFSHQQVWLARIEYFLYNPDYILLDARDGQSPSNSLYSPRPKQMVRIVGKDPNYQLVYTEGWQFLFKRK